MADAPGGVRIAELAGLAAFLLAAVVAVAIGAWSFLSVLVGLPDYLVRATDAVSGVSFGLVLASGLLGLVVSVVLMVGWLAVASMAYGRLKGLLGRR